MANTDLARVEHVIVGDILALHFGPFVVTGREDLDRIRVRLSGHYVGDETQAATVTRLRGRIVPLYRTTLA